MKEVFLRQRILFMLLDLKLISMQSMQYALYHVFQKTHDKHL